MASVSSSSFQGFPYPGFRGRGGRGRGGGRGDGNGYSYRGGGRGGRGGNSGGGGYGMGRLSISSTSTTPLSPQVNPDWLPRGSLSGIQFHSVIPPPSSSLTPSSLPMSSVHIPTITQPPTIHPAMASLRKPVSASGSASDLELMPPSLPTSSSSQGSKRVIVAPDMTVSSAEPWNDKNRLLTENDVFDIFERAGFKDARQHMLIHRLDYYQRAFVHSSYLRKNVVDSASAVGTPAGTIPLFDEDYENQEFLGDRVLELAIAFYIFRRYPNTDQGFKTVLKTKLVRKDTLAKFAKHLQLPNYLIISRQVEEQTQDGRYNQRILEDIMEAFICAIFLDQNESGYHSSVVSSYSHMRLMGPGWMVANAFIEYLLETVVDFEELISKQENYKEQLLQYYQKQFNKTPQYISIDVDGPENRRIFTQGVMDIAGNIIGRGVAAKKIDAEQKASMEALRYYGEL